MVPISPATWVRPWVLENRHAKPTSPYVQKLNKWLCTNVQDDLVIRFKFFETTQDDMLIHPSRLRFVGGPLAVFVKKGFVENETKCVQLGPEDDACVMNIVKDYLYCKEIFLGGFALSQIVKAIRSCHRWQLDDLVWVLCACVWEWDMLKNAHHVLEAKSIAVLPGLSEGFRGYFWSKVGVYYDEFYKGGELEALGLDHPIHVRLCPSFADMWTIAMGDGMLVRLFRLVRKFSKRVSDADLLQLVIQHLEPLTANGNDICEMLNDLDLEREEWVGGFDGKNWEDGKCSVRAVRLLAKAMYGTGRERKEWRTEMRVNLSRRGWYGYTVQFNTVMEERSEFQKESTIQFGEPLRKPSAFGDPISIRLEVGVVPLAGKSTVEVKCSKRGFFKPVAVTAVYWEEKRARHDDVWQRVKSLHVGSEEAGDRAWEPLQKLSATFPRSFLQCRKSEADGCSRIMMALSVRVGRCV